MNQKTQEFLRFLELQTASEGFDLILSKSKRIRFGDGHLCFGYFGFDEATKKPVIKCATGNPESEWVPVLCHEYWHYVQWRCTTKFYNIHPHIKDPDMIYWNWVYRNTHQNEKTPPAIIRESLESVLACEWDAERSALRMIDEWGLRVNRRRLIRKTNQYLYGLVASFQLRKRVRFVDERVSTSIHSSWKKYLI